MSQEHPFMWECQPQAEAFIVKALDKACREHKEISAFEANLLSHTSTRLFDFLDHVALVAPKEELLALGFVEETPNAYFHPGALLPRVVLKEKGTVDIAVSVESISDFLLILGKKAMIEGSPLSSLRRCKVSDGFFIVERRDSRGMEPVDDPKLIPLYFQAKEMWCRRERNLPDEDQAMQNAKSVAKQMIELVGKDLAAWIVLECERAYWQARNTAGQLQKNRQDKLGVGWANHDHHTFRSSRKRFCQLVSFFEMLGFHCRERFYAGEEAGWGAQVMENSTCGLVLFLDVDLDPHELEVDFAHEELKELEDFGTIGLWCALHGDSLLKAGMHHLEAQFMHDTLTKDLKEAGVNMMDPFSNFSYLKQAFTAGEIWPVCKEKVDSLYHSGKITKKQAQKFIAYGAVGSHLENLQRREGYKGFNQKNVSVIIKKTDPRKQ